MKKLLSFSVVVFICMIFFSLETFAMSASGTWRGSDGLVTQSGSVTFNFPPQGGTVDGTYGGTGDIMNFQFGGRFSGNFTGCWGGTMSGTFSGWYSYVSFDDKQESGQANGSWTATLNDDGTINASFEGGGNGGVSAHYSTSVMEKECGPIGGKVEPVAEANATYAYTIVDGKRQIFDNHGGNIIDLVPGTTIGLDHDDGYATIKLGKSSEIFLMGKGTEVTVMTSDQIDESKWGEIVGMQPVGSIVTMEPGQVIVRYHTPTGDEKYWIPDSLVDDVDPEVGYGLIGGGLDGGYGYEFEVRGKTDEFYGMSLISFATKHEGALENVEKNLVGGPRGCLSDMDMSYSPPMPESYYKEEERKNEEERAKHNCIYNFFFNNNSEVFYDYDGENVSIEVHQGEVEVWRTDFDGHAELVAKVPEGQSYEINLADYNIEYGAVDEENPPEVVVSGKKAKSENQSSILQYVIGGGVMLVVFVILGFFGAKRMKKGGISKHWKDY